MYVTNLAASCPFSLEPNHLKRPHRVRHIPVSLPVFSATLEIHVRLSVPDQKRTLHDYLPAPLCPLRYSHDIAPVSVLPLCHELHDRAFGKSRRRLQSSRILPGVTALEGRHCGVSEITDTISLYTICCIVAVEVVAAQAQRDAQSDYVDIALYFLSLSWYYSNSDYRSWHGSILSFQTKSSERQPTMDS